MKPGPKVSKRVVTIAILQLLVAPLAPVCQTPDGKDEWHCKNQPNLLRNDEGKPVWLSSEQLK